jgi:hypothetical protein
MFLTALTACAVPAVASAYAAFRTPGRAAYCGLSEGEPPPGLVCWTPNNGFEVGMRATGRAARGTNRLDRGLYQDLAPVLGFGRTWSGAGFRCASRRGGLTCTNRSGHGWWLGRYRGYRIF